MSHHHSTRKHLDRVLIITAILLGGSLLTSLPALAASPTIENQSTGSYTDDGDGSTKTLESNKVSVTVAEIAGITVTSNGTTGTPNPNSTVYFSFTITNVGNDPTQFYLPKLANLIGNATQGNVEITGYNLNGATPVTLTTPLAVTTAGQTGNNGPNPGLLASNGGGIFLPGGTVTVRVPVTVNGNAANNDPITVQLGDTAVDPASTTTPQARLQNQPYTVGSNDLYTVDNPDNLVATESAGIPFNNIVEASTVQSIAAIVPTTTACPIGGGTADRAITPYISPEVYGTSTTAANIASRGLAVDNLDNAWRAAAGLPQTGTVVPWFGTTASPIGSPSSFTTNGVNVTVELINLAPVDSCTGTVNASGASLSSGSALQDAAPRPGTLDNTANQPRFWNDTGGSDTSRNAARFTFAQPVSAFGAWFGDLETRSITASGTPAILRLLDAGGNQIGNDISIDPTTASDNGPAFTPIDQNTCGGAISGCGNKSTRWVGFVDTNSVARVKQVLVIVGDNNPNTTSVGKQQSLSFIGADIVPLTTAPTISGKVWNDKDASAIVNAIPTFTNINTNGEVGTNAVFGTTTVPVNAILVNATNQVLATQVVGTDGTYSFATVPANTSVKVLLSPTAGTVGSPAPTAAAPTGWVGTSPLDSDSFNTGSSPIIGKDFGIRQKAKLVLLKRITKINGQPTNPNDGTVLNASTTDTYNPGLKVPHTYASNPLAD
jgi:hypothetical protein